MIDNEVKKTFLSTVSSRCNETVLNYARDKNRRPLRRRRWSGDREKRLKSHLHFQFQLRKTHDILLSFKPRIDHSKAMKYSDQHIFLLRAPNCPFAFRELSNRSSRDNRRYLRFTDTKTQTTVRRSTVFIIPLVQKHVSQKVKCPF